MLKKLIEKILGGEELTEEQKKELREYDPEAGTKEVKNLREKLEASQKAKEAAETELKELREFKEKAEAEANNKLSEEEKTKKRLETLEAKVIDAEKERDRVKGEHAALQRKTRIAETAAKHGFKDQEFFDYLTGKANVNLDDATAMTSFIENLKKEHPEQFKADIQSGPPKPPSPPEGKARFDSRDPVGGIIDQLGNAPEIK